MCMGVTASSRSCRSYSKCMFNFTETCHLFSKIDVPVCIPTSGVRAPVDTHWSTCHFGQCEMVFHCGFNINSSNSYWCEHICMYLLAIHSSIIFCEAFIPIFCLIEFSLYNGFTSYLFILDMSPLSNICILNIFSQSYGFIFLKVSFKQMWNDTKKANGVMRQNNGGWKKLF